MQLSAKKLKMRWNFIFQHKYDPKHISKSSKEWLKQKVVNVSEWLNQSPDLIAAKNLWGDLTQAVHRKMTSQFNGSRTFLEEIVGEYELLSQDVPC